MKPAVPSKQPLIQNLSPNADYFYQVVSISEVGDTLMSHVNTFQTALAEDKAVAFAVFCDSQSNPDVWGRISTLAFNERPHFALLGGDLVDFGFESVSNGHTIVFVNCVHSFNVCGWNVVGTAIVGAYSRIKSKNL